jgi:deoxyadenosine/deoxycytidine kinase
MKIAIAGSHGTGKSSLAKELTKQIKGQYIYDTVREEVVLRKIFPINEDTPPEGQNWLVMRQWELERNTPQPWVADKNLFDYLVYGEIVLEKQKSEKAKKILETIKEIVKDNAKYDFIFYLPIEFPMELDGARSENLDFQKEVDRRYKKLLDDLKIKYITLPSFINESVDKEEAIQKRVDLALSYLKK